MTKKRKELPETSGCYIFKNKFDTIIYIGKSKNLKNRVNQYFSKLLKNDFIYGLNIANKDTVWSKITKLVKEIKDFDIILTDTESDALLLECHLIKKHKPKYNTMLKYDFDFVKLKLNTNSNYPLLFHDDKNQNYNYSWNFYKKSTLYNSMEIFNDVWKLPNCSNSGTLTSKKACLRYYIDKCYAPCENKISKSDYKFIIDNLIDFLDNGNEDIYKSFKEKMKNHSMNLNFELSEQILENINSLKKIQTYVKKTNFEFENNKLFLFFRAFNEESYSIFYIENEIILDREIFFIENDNQIKLYNYLNRINSKEFFKIEDYIMINYLLEIVADKVFINYDENFNIDKIIDTDNIYKKFNEKKEAEQHFFNN